MSNYSRQNKETNKDSQETGKASHHIKKGLSAFQKTLTFFYLHLIHSVFSLISPKKLRFHRLFLSMKWAKSIIL